MHKKISTALGILALISIITGLFGLGFQKGMIEKTNIGNIAGNYQPQEIFYSATIGGAHLLSKIEYKFSWEVFFSSLKISSVILFIVLIVFYSHIYYSIKYRKIYALSKKRRRFKLYRFYLKKRKYIHLMIFGIYLLVTIIVSFIVSILNTLLFYIAIICMSPIVFGYIQGGKYIDSLNESHICKKNEQQYICTYISNANSTTPIKMIFENNNGYLIKTPTDYYFTKKDDKEFFTCSIKTSDENSIDNINHRLIQSRQDCSKIEASTTPIKTIPRTKP